MTEPNQTDRVDASSSGRTHAFWCRTPSLPNFGDALTPWFIERLTGQYPQFTPHDSRQEKYFIVGSVMGYTHAPCTVWGSGIISRDDAIAPEAKLIAVRGPLTRRRALESGAACPEVYGDPALLLPRLYQPPVSERRLIGLIAHFSDKPRLAVPLRANRDLKLIDVQDPVESVIDQITSCEFVASSSLHGLIVSHAYGIPAVWIRFRPLTNGDDSKFLDYFLSIGAEPPSPVAAAYDGIDLAVLSRSVVAPSIRLDLERLWSVCPFRSAAQNCRAVYDPLEFGHFQSGLKSAHSHASET